MITRTEVLMGRDKEFPLTPALETNLSKLLIALNKVRAAYGKPMKVSSGYRPGRYNTAAKGAKASAHITCQACDFSDPTGDLDAWCMQNLALLSSCGLRLEHPDSTPGWCHLDIKFNGKVVFKP